MKRIDSYDDFFKKLHSVKEDKMTILFLEGIISEKDYDLYLEGVVNEGWKEIKDWVVNKIVSPLKTAYDWVFNQIVKGAFTGLKILDYITKIYYKIVNFIEKFKEKNPKTYKFIKYALLVLTILIILILYFYLTSQNAAAGEWVSAKDLQKASEKAAKMQQHQDEINAAIGWIKDRASQQLQEGNVEGKDLLKTAAGYLQDLKDGKLDYKWSEATKTAGDFAISNLKKFASNQQDPTYQNWIQASTEWFRRVTEEGMTHLSELSQKMKK